MAIESLLLLLASLTILLHTPTTLAQTNTATPQGNIEGTDGSKCVWFELRPKPTETVLTTACHCRSRDGDMQTFSCQYEGDLSNCSAYKEDSRLLYESITSGIASKNNNSTSMCMYVHVRLVYTVMSVGTCMMCALSTIVQRQLTHCIDALY